MRKGVGLLIGLCCGVLLVATYSLWPKLQNKFGSSNISLEDQSQDLAHAKRFLQENDPKEAMKIIRKYDDLITIHTEEGSAWLDLLIQAAEEIPNPYQLVLLHEYFPDLFVQYEKASTLIAQAYLLNKQVKEFNDIRDKWRGRETLKDRWQSVDVDYLIVQGKNKEAIAILESERFENKSDLDRLLRLAILVVNDDAKKAWNLLDQAYQIDPQNIDVRLYRARLLEATGNSSGALREYLAAIHIQPNDPTIRDQLAEFYRRAGQYELALSTWRENLPPPSTDGIWLKTWFWSHFVTPIPVAWDDYSIPEGPIQPLVQYLIDLPKDQYWSENSFESIPNHSFYLRQQQATLWLRVLDALKRGNEERASQLLQYNPFKKVSWNPKLERALHRILNWRLNKTLVVSDPRILTPLNPNATPKNALLSGDIKFFDELEKLVKEKQTDPKSHLSKEMRAILSSPDVYAIAFLSAGWYEAALQLQKQETLPKVLPGWIAYGFTQAYRLNRGPETALNFAKKQYRTPELSLLAGEIYASEGKTELAIKLWEKLATKNDSIGQRAAWLISTTYLEQNQLDLAEETISKNPGMSQAVKGKEVLARIALSKNDQKLAFQLYRQIQDKSAEAKSYLAQKAYYDGNIELAKQLTEELLEENPTNLEIQKNLLEILNAEKNE